MDNGLADLQADIKSTLEVYFDLLREANRAGYVIFFETTTNEAGEASLGKIHFLRSVEP